MKKVLKVLLAGFLLEIFTGTAQAVDLELIAEMNNWVNDGLGQSVSSVGDLKSDGYDDVIVGAPQGMSYPPP